MQDMILKSDSLGKLATSLAKAQREIKGAKKDSSNPFFKSKYADFESVQDACREPLATNELAYVQIPVGDAHLATVLMHSSGEFIGGIMNLHPKALDPQGVGSSITYGRRYSLSAIAGVAQVDDDGEAAMNRDERVEQEEVKYAGNQKPFPVRGAFTEVINKGDRSYVQVDGKTCYSTAETNKKKLADLTGKDVELLVMETNQKVNGKKAYSIHMVTPYVIEATA